MHLGCDCQEFVAGTGCVARNTFRREEAVELIYYAAIPNKPSTNFACPIVSLPPNFLTCPFLIMYKASLPTSVRSAAWNERKHCITRHLRLIKCRLDPPLVIG